MSFETYRFELEHHDKTSKKNGNQDFSSYMGELLKQNNGAAIQILASPMFRNYINESKILNEESIITYMIDTPKPNHVSETDFIDLINSFPKSSVMTGVKKGVNDENIKMKPFIFNVTNARDDMEYFKSVIRDISGNDSQADKEYFESDLQINITLNTDNVSGISLILKPKQILQISNLKTVESLIERISKAESIISKELVSDLDYHDLHLVICTAIQISNFISYYSKGDFTVGTPPKFKLNSSSVKRKLKAKGRVVM